MLAQSLRASRSSVARLARQQVVAKRTFIAPTAVRRADLVQTMYLNELKAYKAPAVKASDADGVVQKFVPPTAPASPAELDLASELKDYEASTVDVEGQAAGGAAAAAEADWFEEEPEEEAAHH